MAKLQLNREGVGQTVILALFCAAGLAAVVLIGIVPRCRELRSCNGTIVALQAKLDEQAILQPLYAELQNQARKSLPTTLARPVRSRLKADKMADLTSLFSRLAQDSGVELVYAVPEAKSLEAGYTRILVKLLAQGPVTQFRGFLLALVGTPYLDHIDRVEIQRGTPAEELRLQMWIAIE